MADFNPKEYTFVLGDIEKILLARIKRHEQFTTIGSERSRMKMAVRYSEASQILGLLRTLAKEGVSKL